MISILVVAWESYCSSCGLFRKVLKGIEKMCRIEALIVLSVTSFHFTIMSGRKGTDQLVPDSMFHETNLKNSRFIQTTIGTETFPFCFVYQTDGRHKFHIDLDMLTRILHLLMRFSNVLGIGGLSSHNTLLTQKTI